MPVLSTLGAAIANVYGFTSGLIKDQYFNLVSLLLPGNGTNGAQNNTFLDSGTANSGSGFTITRNGNTTQGTFSPFSQTGWGNYFGGNAYLSIGSNSVLAPGTGDFTLEGWINLNSLPSSGNASAIFQNDVLGFSGSDKFWFGVFNSSGTYRLQLGRHGTSNATYVNWTPTLGVWYHVAVTRSSGTTRLFIDGVSQTVTGGSDFSGVTLSQAGAVIGAASTPWYLTGYISNLRYTVGAALYTASFTPITSPLTTTSQNASASQVEILTCQSNRFLDNSSNSFALALTNSPSVVAFSPFAPTQSYSAAAVGGSGYFDGTGDYLSVPDDASLDMGSSSFTIECFIYPATTITTGQGSAVFGKRASGAVYGGVTGEFYESWAPRYISTVTGSSWGVNIVSSIACIQNQWNHVAWVRDANTWTIYVNGASGGSTTLSGTIPDNSAAFTIGATNAAADGFLSRQAYISNFRIVKGTAVYTSDFTPPTAPLTAITNTSLLLNFTNAGVVDATAKNVLETVGNAQISTTQSKWGGGSIYFDGTGSPADYLSFPDSPTIRLGSSDFVFECWARFDDFSSTRHLCFLNGNTSAYAGLRLGVGTDSKIFLLMSQNGSTFAVSSGAIGSALSANTWYYIAVQRSSAGVKVFVDGSQIGITYSLSGSVMSGTVNYLGEITSVSQPMKGYMDDVRLTLYARTITASPTAPFPLQ